LKITVNGKDSLPFYEEKGYLDQSLSKISKSFENYFADFYKEINLNSLEVFHFDVYGHKQKNQKYIYINTLGVWVFVCIQ